MTSVKWTFVHIGKDVKIDLWQLQRISPTDCPDEERTFKIKLLSECCNFLVFPPRVISVGHFVIITVGALVVIIGPESDHWECLSVTHSLTNCCLGHLIDVTLRCEDANSKLVEVVTVADVDAENHVGNSLLIWELTYGHKAKLLFRL